MVDDLFERDDDGGEDIHLVRAGRPSAGGARWARLIFGLLGTVLGLIGVGKVGFFFDAGLPMRLAAALLMGAVAAFFLFNVLLARTWRWPGRLCLIALPLLFVVRLGFGP